MPNHDPLVRLLHMRDYAKQALEMASGKSREELDNNAMFRLALTRLIELVGEAASQYPRQLQSQYPQIPWPKLISMRNRLIHGYDFIDNDILWEAITKNLPQLLNELDKIIPAGM